MVKVKRTDSIDERECNMVCPECKKELKDTARFCGVCGCRLTVSENKNIETHVMNNAGGAVDETVLLPKKAPQDNGTVLLKKSERSVDETVLLPKKAPQDNGTVLLKNSERSVGETVLLPKKEPQDNGTVLLSNNESSGCDTADNKTEKANREYVSQNMVKKRRRNEIDTSESIVPRSGKAVRTIMCCVTGIIILAAGFVGGLLAAPELMGSIRADLTAAEKTLALGEADAALEMYNDILVRDPQNIEAILGRSRCYRAEGDTEQALAVLDAGYSLTGNELLWIELERLEQSVK